MVRCIHVKMFQVTKPTSGFNKPAWSDFPPSKFVRNCVRATTYPSVIMTCPNSVQRWRLERSAWNQNAGL